jgi:hypothetical protein
MKKLIITLAVVTVAASPALAKKYQKRVTTNPDMQAYQSDPAYQAYAYQPGQGYSNSVYAFGQYQGADPDSFIRLQLLRDPPTVQW